MNKYLRWSVQNWVEQIAESFSLEYVAPTFAGCTESALSLAASLSNEKRGLVAVALWKAKIPRDAYREFLQSVWMQDHRHLIEAAGNRRTIAHMFDYAAFPIPVWMPPTVTVWRGVHGISIKQAKQGFSWTTNRNLACWFACRPTTPERLPLVIRAQVAKENIALFTNEREESEALLTKLPSAVTIDGTSHEWKSVFEKYQRDRVPSVV